MSQSHGDQTFLRAFREVARSLNLNPDLEDVKDIRTRIHIEDLGALDRAEKDDLWRDYPALKVKMKDWIEQYIGIENELIHSKHGHRSFLLCPSF